MGRRNEAHVLEVALDRLAFAFTIRREVPGWSIDGRRVRLDAVLYPINKDEWKNPDVALGIEAKDAAPQRGDFRNAAAWIAQCIDYSYAEWDGLGRIPIFAWPPITENIHTGGFDVIPHLLGQFNIGELHESEHYGYMLVMHQRHRVWSEQKGVEHGKRWTLTPRVGSTRRGGG